jgi:hypothetical protein
LIVSPHYCTAEKLLEHADAIAHAAALGGYLDDRTGRRRTLAQAERERWAASAAILREAAHRMTRVERRRYAADAAFTCESQEPGQGPEREGNRR